MIRYKAEVDALVTISRETQGWLTNYNIRHNYSSPWRLSEALNGHTELLKSLAQYKDKTSKTLSSVFDKATVSTVFPHIIAAATTVFPRIVSSLE